jgi:hypothetical protein
VPVLSFLANAVAIEDNKSFIARKQRLKTHHASRTSTGPALPSSYSGWCINLAISLRTASKSPILLIFGLLSALKQKERLPVNPAETALMFKVTIDEKQKKEKSKKARRS